MLFGPLSAVAIPPGNVIQTFGLEPSATPPAGIFVAPAVSAIAIRAEGRIVSTGSVTFDGSLSATDITFTGNVVSAYAAPLIANGDFLQVTVNGTSRYIRLWNFY